MSDAQQTPPLHMDAVEAAWAERTAEAVRATLPCSDNTAALLVHRLITTLLAVRHPDDQSSSNALSDGVVHTSCKVLNGDLQEVTRQSQPVLLQTQRDGTGMLMCDLGRGARAFPSSFSFIGFAVLPENATSPSPPAPPCWFSLHGSVDGIVWVELHTTRNSAAWLPNERKTVNIEPDSQSHNGFQFLRLRVGARAWFDSSAFATQVPAREAAAKTSMHIAIAGWQVACSHFVPRRLPIKSVLQELSSLDLAAYGRQTVADLWLASRTTDAPAPVILAGQFTEAPSKLSGPSFGIYLEDATGHVLCEVGSISSSRFLQLSTLVTDFSVIPLATEASSANISLDLAHLEVGSYVQALPNIDHLEADQVLSVAQSVEAMARPFRSFDVQGRVIARSHIFDGQFFLVRLQDDSSDVPFSHQGATVDLCFRNASLAQHVLLQVGSNVQIRGITKMSDMKAGGVSHRVLMVTRKCDITRVSNHTSDVLLNTSMTVPSDAYPQHASLQLDEEYTTQIDVTLTSVINRELGVYQINDHLLLFIVCHACRNFGRGLRAGAVLRLGNVIAVASSTRYSRHVYGYTCNSKSSIDILHFSEDDAAYHPLLTSENPLIQLAGSSDPLATAKLFQIYSFLASQWSDSKDTFGPILSAQNPHDSILSRLLTIGIPADDPTSNVVDDYFSETTPASRVEFDCPTLSLISQLDQACPHHGPEAAEAESAVIVPNSGLTLCGCLVFDADGCLCLADPHSTIRVAVLPDVDYTRLGRLWAIHDFKLVIETTTMLSTRTRRAYLLLSMSTARLLSKVVIPEYAPLNKSHVAKALAVIPSASDVGFVALVTSRSLPSLLPSQSMFDPSSDGPADVPREFYIECLRFINSITTQSLLVRFHGAAVKWHALLSQGQFVLLQGAQLTDVPGLAPIQFGAASDASVRVSVLSRQDHLVNALRAPPTPDDVTDLVSACEAIKSAGYERLMSFSCILVRKETKWARSSDCSTTLLVHDCLQETVTATLVVNTIKHVLPDGLHPGVQLTVRRALAKVWQANEPTFVLVPVSDIELQHAPQRSSQPARADLPTKWLSDLTLERSPLLDMFQLSCTLTSILSMSITCVCSRCSSRVTAARCRNACNAGLKTDFNWIFSVSCMVDDGSAEAQVFAQGPVAHALCRVMPDTMAELQYRSERTGFLEWRRFDCDEAQSAPQFLDILGDPAVYRSILLHCHFRSQSASKPLFVKALQMNVARSLRLCLTALNAQDTPKRTEALRLLAKLKSK